MITEKIRCSASVYFILLSINTILTVRLTVSREKRHSLTIKTGDCKMLFYWNIDRIADRKSGSSNNNRIGTEIIRALFRKSLSASFSHPSSAYSIALFRETVIITTVSKYFLQLLVQSADGAGVGFSGSDRVSRFRRRNHRRSGRFGKVQGVARHRPDRFTQCRVRFYTVFFG